MEGPKTEKARATNRGKSGTRNQEAESIRSRGESTGLWEGGGGKVEDSYRAKTEQCA